jgi:S-methylmethionine-dependent homocysteine/selenocysteine methylase
MNIADALCRRASAGEVIVIDGGMGTELEARGVPMDTHAWSANANVAAADLVQLIHEDYIRAGAEVIITNTFSTCRPPLVAAGLGERVHEINRGAAEAAVAARHSSAADRPVAIAGSLSHVQMGNSPREWPTDDRGLHAVFREQADVLAEGGVDVLVVEMATAESWVFPAVDAALETGLPVWVGLSFEQPVGSPAPVLRGDNEPSPDGFVSALIGRGVSALFVMHTDVDVVDGVLPRVLAAGVVPVGVYPHSGTFQSPNWTAGTITPERFALAANGWVSQGATLVGGCCGIAPAHIRQLVEEARVWNAGRAHSAS